MSGAPPRAADGAPGTSGSCRRFRAAGENAAGSGSAATPAPVAGAHFAEIPVGAIVPNPRQPRQVFDEEAMAELVHSIQEIGLLQPIVVRARRPEPLRAGHGRAPLAGRPAGRPGARIPAIVRRDRRRRHAARRPAGEPAPFAAEPAGGGRRLPAAAGRLRLHPRGAGRPDRPQPPADLQHPAVAASSPRPSSAGSRRACSVRRARPRPARSRATPTRRTGSPARVVAEGISVRGLEELVAVGETGAEERGTPRIRRASPRPPDWTTSTTGSRTGSTPGSRSTWAGPRAGSPSSSPRWPTSSGSSG